MKASPVFPLIFCPIYYPLLCAFDPCCTPEWLKERVINLWLSSVCLLWAERDSLVYFPNLFLTPSVVICVFPAGGAGSDLSLHGEAASDHRPDGVLPGGHQGERPQWIPAGNTHCQWGALEQGTGQPPLPLLLVLGWVKSREHISLCVLWDGTSTHILYSSRSTDTRV